MSVSPHLTRVHFFAWHPLRRIIFITNAKICATRNDAHFKDKPHKSFLKSHSEMVWVRSQGSVSKESVQQSSGKKRGFEECVEIISLQYNKVWILYHVEMINNRSHLNRQYLCLLHSKLKQIIRGFRPTACDCSAACTNLMMKLHKQILFFSYRK